MCKNGGQTISICSDVIYYKFSQALHQLHNFERLKNNLWIENLLINKKFLGFYDLVNYFYTFHTKTLLHSYIENSYGIHEISIVDI